MSGDVTITSGDPTASGGSYASGISKDGDAVTFTVDAGQGGTFTFSPRYSSPQADGANHQVMIDMGKKGQQKLLKYVTFNKTESASDWREDISINVELTPGTHTISFPIDKYREVRARQHRLHYVPRVQHGLRQARGRGVRGERRAPPGARRLWAHAGRSVLR